MSVFRTLDCLSLVFCSNTTLLKLQTVLFLFFFQILRFEIGGAAYLWMRLIHGRLRYFIFKCKSVCQLPKYSPFTTCAAATTPDEIPAREIIIIISKFLAHDNDFPAF